MPRVQGGKPGPSDPCICGHEHRYHFGDGGPCIAGTPSGEASVCGCVRFDGSWRDDRP